MNRSDLYFAQAEMDFRRERATSTIRGRRRRWPRQPTGRSPEALRSRGET